MGRDTIQLETAISTISSEYLLEFTSEYGIAEELHPELPNDRVFPTAVDWRISAPKDEMPVVGSYSLEDVVVINTRRTPIQKQPEALLCLVGLSRRYFLGDDVYPTFFYDDNREMDLFNLISALNSTKVKTRTRPRAAHEVPLLIATATHVIAMEDATGLSSSLRRPSTMEKSPLDFSNEDFPRRITKSDITENQGQETVAPEVPPQENVPTVGLHRKWALRRRLPPWDPLLDTGSTLSMPTLQETPAKYGLHPLSYAKPRSIPEREIAQLDTGSTLSMPTLQETPADVSDPDPLSYAKPQSIPEWKIAQSSKGATVVGDPDSEKSTSFTSFTRSPNGIYQPGWGVTNSFRLESSDVCRDVVAMGSQLRLRFEQEVRLLKRATEKVARRDQRIQAREEEIKKLDQEIHSFKSADTKVQVLRNQTKNLEALLEAEADMKKATEAKNVELAEELESLRAKFLDLQVNYTQLSQQVSSLQAQIIGEERIKAAFEEFKRYEDDKVEQWCA
ncbi:hypothetical protein Tco_0623985 [Tanacetum coccineum]|uniref:Transposase (Putative), gypsy type n=1 Tax=Tanacetum coccineum TaxID=301880 RepID=A0ABQ4WCQ4_9ASTR